MKNQLGTAKARDADFYLGRGRKARYLGTIQGAVLDQWPSPSLWQPGGDEFGEEDFLTMTASMITTETWPHPYPDSRGTFLTYAYDSGSVYGYQYGVEMLIIRCNFRHWVPAHVAHRDRNPDGPAKVWVPRKSSPWPTIGANQ